MESQRDWGDLASKLLGVGLLFLLLVPHPVFALLAPSDVILAKRTQPDLRDVLAWTAVFLAVLVSFRNSRQPYLLALVAIYGTSLLGTAGMGLEAHPVARNCLAVLSAFSPGLLVPRLLRHQTLAIRLFFGVALVQALLAFGLWSAGIGNLQSGSLARAAGTLANVNALAFFLASATAVALGFSRHSRGILPLLGLAALIGGAAITGSRAAMIAIFAVAVYGWLKNRGWREFLPLIAAAIALGGVWHARLDGPVRAASTARSNAGRTALVARGVEVFRANPWSGVGIGALSLPVDRPASIEKGAAPVMTMTEPKNVYVLMLAEAGVPGLLIMVGLFMALRRALQEMPPGFVRDSIGGVLLVFAIYGFWDSPFATAGRMSGNFILGYVLALLLLRPCRTPEPFARNGAPESEEERPNGDPEPVRPPTSARLGDSFAGAKDGG